MSDDVVDHAKRPGKRARPPARVAPGSKPRTQRPPSPTRQTGSVRLSSTGQDLVDATIKAIYEDGMGNTSSSAVVRRIGATWSVIQYHFGSWEALLLEAIKQMAARNYEIIIGTSISGDTIEQRLTAFSDMIFSLHGSGQYNVIVEIAIHIRTNHKIHASTIKLSDEIVRKHDDAIVGLLRQVTPILATSLELRNQVYCSLTGLAMSLEAIRVLYHDMPAVERHPDPQRQRTLLTRALAMLLEHEEALAAAPAQA